MDVDRLLSYISFRIRANSKAGSNADKNANVVGD